MHGSLVVVIVARVLFVSFHTQACTARCATLGGGDPRRAATNVPDECTGGARRVAAGGCVQDVWAAHPAAGAWQARMSFMRRNEGGASRIPSVRRIFLRG